MHQDDYFLQNKTSDPIAFVTKNDEDTLHYGQILPIEKIPEREKVLDAVWAMRRKINILTKQIYRWKARLNLYWGPHEFGVNYFETYSPVVNWLSLWLLLIHALIFRLHMRQINVVMAYLQVPIENLIYMKFPQGIRSDKGSKKKHTVKLIKNLYGQKQDGRVWFKYLTEKHWVWTKRCWWMRFLSGTFDFLPLRGWWNFHLQGKENYRRCNKRIKKRGPRTWRSGSYIILSWDQLQIHRWWKNIMSQPQLIDSIIRNIKIKNSKNVPELPALFT